MNETAILISASISTVLVALSALLVGASDFRQLRRANAIRARRRVLLEMDTLKKAI